MTTKKQEQEALDKIREILEGLDRDSWLNWAFDGCVDMAQRNLFEDSANSMMEQRDTARAKVEELEADIEVERFNLREHKKMLEEARASIRDWEKHNENMWERFEALREKKEALQDKADEQAQTIIELKAELYDYMKKEAE